MMMFPGITCSPPNFFTPSRLPGESRPFFVVPPAFFVAHRTCGLSVQTSEVVVDGSDFVSP